MAGATELRMTIIVGTDFSRVSTTVADVAAELARRRNDDLVIAHVVDGPLLPASFAPRVHERIDAEARRLRAHGCHVRTALLPEGNFGRRLGELAEKERATLLVVGAQGAGLRSPLGTVAQAAVRHVTCPVLLVRHPERLWIGRDEAERLRVLVPFALDDTDATLRDVLDIVASTGDVDGDFVHYVSVPEPDLDWRRTAAPTSEPALRAYFGELPAGVAVRALLERDAFGRLDSHVADLARERDVDLVLCGSHHRHGVERLKGGSIAEGILLHAPVSVLVARAPAAPTTMDKHITSTLVPVRDNSAP
jgi:nucleotide-binding universal stress UspA family protein